MTKKKREPKLSPETKHGRTGIPLLDKATKSPSLPDLDFNIRCNKHPDKESATGHGLAGGGYGPYTYCPTCSKVLSKTEEE